ncbi:acetaldehyde dehydrogenase (acetylating) [Carboxydothermus ferrireducens]|uniref:Acetaldehyde dehydrogenase (Acetylating) n=1 Tax=Carboxydothermus ferrireducens DSM 11255 TaxID=1119529 RepID=A0ABX2RD02_9THEO|nr:acetaldehyde dehydrogenase (acetylating) [Carboxydothermus ferrireducens]NYE58477.1 acetaldehyde dehydrogenase (acetylating) [Carboxydothermus ferrireducens DSM 11255]
MALDYDLSSIQEARDLARKAKAAQQVFATFSQEKIDKIVQAMAEAGKANAEWLARMAVDETKFGVFEHKVTKNMFAAVNVYNYIKDMKTVGVLKEDKKLKILEVAVPVGVILGLIPSTNPTSTTIYKALIALKAGNGIVFSPHPNAARCTYAAAEVMHEAAVKAGAPEGIIGCLTKITMAATNELMHHEDIDLILATGGSAMVKAAYSSGKPAYGVGPGNVPVFIERTANISQAVSDIILSKTFDNGVICASEQAIIADEPIKDKVLEELRAQGAYILSEEEVRKVSSVVMNPKGGMNPAMVGKNAVYVAEKANIKVPPDTKLLVAPLDGYGPSYPLSYEKLTTVIAFYTAKDWHEACLLSIELLNLGGKGHSFVIHTQDENIAREFIQKPVSRILVNTPASQGAIGFSTGLPPSLTLGCGTLGGSSTSDNVTPMHLINIKRQAYGIYDVSVTPRNEIQVSRLSNEDIAKVVKAVLEQLQL